jgi:hypothetical protein
MRLRGFLREQPAATHALLVSGTRVSPSALAEDLATLAVERGQTFALVGPVALRNFVLDRGWSWIPEDTLERPEEVRAHVERDHLRRELGEPRTAIVLVAPTAAFAGRVLALDDALDDGAGGIAARYCLLPRSALRDRGAPEALALVQRHAVSFALA